MEPEKKAKDYKDQDVKLLAFVGLAGSGKSSAVEHMTTRGYPKIYFGGVIYKAMTEAGLTPGDWEQDKQFREGIREREGKDFVVRRVVQNIYDLVEAGQKRILLDGLYTWTEYKVLKSQFPGVLTVVAIVAPRHLRKQRMAKRPERPMTPAELDQRDWDEIENIEKGGPIAIADYFIRNNGNLDDFHEQIDQTLEEIKF